MSYPAQTTDGETVQIVSKETVDAANAHASTILKSEDGRTFVAAKQGGLIEEITAIIEEGVESVSETVDDAADSLRDGAERFVDEVKETAEGVVDRVEDALGMGDDNEPETPAA